MGLFDSTSKATTANTSGSEQQQTQQQDTNTQGSTNSTSQQAQTSQSAGASTNTSGGSQVVTNLSSSDQAFLQSLLPVLTAHAANPNTTDADVIRSIGQTLQANAAKPVVSAADINAQKGAAITAFNQNEAPGITQLEQSIGSRNNTYSQLVEQKGQQDLASTLAGIVANADVTNAQFTQSNLEGAASATGAAGSLANTTGSSAISQLMAVIQGLTGATQTTQATQASTGTTANTANDLANTIQQVLTAQQQSQTTNADAQLAAFNNTTGSQSSTPSIISLFA